MNHFMPSIAGDIQCCSPVVFKGGISWYMFVCAVAPLATAHKKIHRVSLESIRKRYRITFWFQTFVPC